MTAILTICVISFFLTIIPSREEAFLLFKWIFFAIASVSAGIYVQLNYREPSEE